MTIPTYQQIYAPGVPCSCLRVISKAVHCSGGTLACRSLPIVQPPIRGWPRRSVRHEASRQPDARLLVEGRNVLLEVELGVFRVGDNCGGRRQQGGKIRDGRQDRTSAGMHRHSSSPRPRSPLLVNSRRGPSAGGVDTSGVSNTSDHEHTLLARDLPPARPHPHAHLNAFRERLSVLQQNLTPGRNLRARDCNTVVGRKLRILLLRNKPHPALP